MQLQAVGLALVKVIFFIDSQAANLALSSNTPTDCLNTIQCRTQIAELISYGGTGVLQGPKCIIFTCIVKCTSMTHNSKSLGKSWETLAAVGPIQRHLWRTETVDLFRLTTGHDFLGVYLHCLDLAAEEAYLLCGHTRIDDDHLIQSTGLEFPTNDVVSRFWEA
ncbi:reverse transcriptase [Trichonephila clavipes]|nr:reverse transcriptase [Trichonephila clavipes]